MTAAAFQSTAHSPRLPSAIPSSHILCVVCLAVKVKVTVISLTFFSSISAGLPSLPATVNCADEPSARFGSALGTAVILPFSVIPHSMSDPDFLTGSLRFSRGIFRYCSGVAARAGLTNSPGSANVTSSESSVTSASTSYSGSTVPTMTRKFGVPASSQVSTPASPLPAMGEWFCHQPSMATSPLSVATFGSCTALLPGAIFDLAVHLTSSTTSQTSLGLLVSAFDGMAVPSASRVAPADAATNAFNRVLIRFTGCSFGLTAPPGIRGLPLRRRPDTLVSRIPVVLFRER